MSTPPLVRVFVSYSHEAEEHRQRVRALVERLRREGVTAIFDQHFEEVPPAEGWPRWMQDQVENADFVLVVATETYNRRFRGQEVAGQGRGVTWEGAIITQQLYEAQGYNLKYIPVVFTEDDTNHIPLPLRSTAHYLVSADVDYDRLYFRLTGQVSSPTPLGQVRLRTLSQEALEILQDTAAAPTRSLSHREELGGGVIRVEEGLLIREQEDRSRFQQFQVALQELQRRGFLTAYASGETYALTDDGGEYLANHRTP